MPGPHVGIDTIAVRGRVKDYAIGSLPVQLLKKVMDDRTGAIGQPSPTSSTVMLRDHVRLIVRRRDGATWAEAEFSVPRWLRGDNSEPASIADVRRALAEFYAEASWHVEWDCEVGELVIDRLDIARDFTAVTDSDDLLERLSHLPAVRAHTRLERTADCAGAQTLYRSTDRWLTRLYDRGRRHENLARSRRGLDRYQHMEQGLKERDKVRFEVQLRGRRAVEGVGIRTVTDLSADLLWQLAERYFRRSRFDSIVGTTGGRLASLAADARANGREKDFVRAVSFLIQQRHGVTAIARSTAARYRKWADELGLTPADVSFEAESRRVQLDLASGTLVDLGAIVLELQLVA